MQIPVKFDYFLVEKPWSINIKHEHKTFQSLCFSKMRDHDYCLQSQYSSFYQISPAQPISPFKNKIKAHFVYEVGNGRGIFHCFRENAKYKGIDTKKI